MALPVINLYIGGLDIKDLIEPRSTGSSFGSSLSYYDAAGEDITELFLGNESYNVNLPSTALRSSVGTLNLKSSQISGGDIGQLFCALGCAPDSKVYSTTTSPGTYSVSVGTAVSRYHKSSYTEMSYYPKILAVRIHGGGGQGGGCNGGTLDGYGGGGGGGGSVAIAYWVYTSGDYYIVGAGGTSGTGRVGSGGGLSIISNSGTTKYIICYGGGGGNYNTAGSGGTTSYTTGYPSELILSYSGVSGGAGATSVSVGNGAYGSDFGNRVGIGVSLGGTIYTSNVSYSDGGIGGEYLSVLLAGMGSGGETSSGGGGACYYYLNHFINRHFSGGGGGGYNPGEAGNDSQIASTIRGGSGGSGSVSFYY